MVPTMIHCGTYIVSRERDEIHRLLYEMIPKDDIYMHYRLGGTLLDVCTDVYFLAHEHGEGLSRVWMYWGKHAGAVSNWGAVFTKEEHRGRGLCRIVLGRRNEIDCLLRFALVDRGIPFGIGEERDLYPILMKSPERAKVLLTPDGKTVGWMLDGKAQVHPTYEKAQILL